jgi:hypothetical protein
MNAEEFNQVPGQTEQFDPEILAALNRPESDVVPVPPTLGDPCEMMPPTPSVPWLNTVKPETTQPRRKARQAALSSWN